MQGDRSLSLKALVNCDNFIDWCLKHCNTNKNILWDSRDARNCVPGPHVCKGGMLCRHRTTPLRANTNVHFVLFCFVSVSVMCMHICACRYTHMQRPEEDVGTHSLSLSILFNETEFLMET